MKAVIRAYGLWLAGVLSAAAAAYFLYRSRLVSLELADGYESDLEGLEGAGLSERIQGYTE